jgi:hypothetical protein
MATKTQRKKRPAQKPPPKPAKPKQIGRRTRLTNAKLRALAVEHKPLRSWHDTEEDGLY